MSRLAKFFLPLLIVASAFAMQKDSPTLERARQRWERLSREDQERFRERYERFRNLSEDERRVLADRAARMAEAKERFKAGMSPAVRAKLEALEPRQRELVLKELVENAARERGARIREKLPATWVERLESARPEQRALFLADLQRRGREKATPEAIERIGRKLGLAPTEVERLKGLSGPERTAAVLDLGKALSVKYVTEFGLPPGLTEQQWNEWRALPPNEFFEVVQRHRCEHGWRGPGPGHEGDERGAQSDGSPPLIHRLMAALRPTPEEILQYGDLPAEERRQRIFEERRGRVLQILRESKKLDEALLSEWSKLSEPEFFKSLRQQFSRAPEHRGGPRSGPGEMPPDMRDQRRGGSPLDREKPHDDRRGARPREHAPKD